MPFCGGNVLLNPIDNNASDGVAVWSGSGVGGIVNDELALLLLGSVPYSITYTATTTLGCEDSLDCTFTIINTCAASGGQF